MKYLVFSFPRSGNGVKRGVEFRHSIRNVSIIRRKVENESALMGTESPYTRSPLPNPAMCGTQREAKKTDRIGKTKTIK